MVLPLLAALPVLGLLGAGKYLGGYLDQVASDRAIEHRGDQMRDAMGGLLGNPNATADDYGRNFAMAGLLGAEDYMASGFDFMKMNQEQQNRLAAIAASGAQTRANQDHAAALAAQAKQGDIDAQNLIAEELRNDPDAIFNYDPEARKGLVKLNETYTGPLTALSDRTNRLTELESSINEARAAGISLGVAGGLGPEAQAARADISQKVNGLLFDYVKQNYGDREPTPAVMESLVNSFGLTGREVMGPGGSIDAQLRLIELMRARTEAEQQRLTGDYEFQKQALTDPLLGPRGLFYSGEGGVDVNTGTDLPPGFVEGF